MLQTHIGLALAAALTFASPALAHAGDYEDPTPTLPLARAHAHNDYEHTVPLLDALGLGFTSVEADIWLVDGALLVAHDLEDVEPERTLEALYLAPLAEIARTGDGLIHADFPHSVQLLIDLKSEAEPTYRALHRLLARYADVVTVFTARGVREGAITAVISGNRPRELMEGQWLRFAGYDGRATDLGAGAPASFMPLISHNWELLFTWRGEGAFPDAENEALQNFVNTAHENGQRVRFWATPDAPATREAVWRVLLAAGVDYINTDDLAGLAAFLATHDATPSEPPLDWF
ncbi:MAG: phosphatidylinositol-specific phospholipase C/glycerophosphodiester phosphodiesterase family protein [Polyangiales bacterium]